MGVPNLPCLWACAAVCEALIGATGIGAILCVLGCEVACDPDTLQADGNPPPPYSMDPSDPFVG